MRIIKIFFQILAALTLLGFAGVLFLVVYLEKQYSGLGYFVGVILALNVLVQFILFKDDSPCTGYY